MGGRNAYWLLLLLPLALVAYLGPARSSDVDTLKPIGNPPERVLCDGGEHLEAFQESWYCDPLRRTGEPIVPSVDLAKTKQAYRLIWLRSFHPGIVIRVEVVSSRSASLTASQMATNHGGAGDLVLQKTVALDPGDIAFLNKSFSEDGFWRQPHEFHQDMGFGSFSSPIPLSQQTQMLDGALWIVEGVEAGRYQVVGDSTGDAVPVRLGKVLIALAHKKIPALTVEPIY